MSERIKALVVEDDLEIQEDIRDVLVSLGHDHDWAESQQDARALIERNSYHYVLADLEIPARTGRGFAKIDYGKDLVEQIQQIKGRGVVPVIVMTGHHRDGLNLATELLGNGAMEFISKPFKESTAAHNLAKVIRTVLDKHRRVFPKGLLPGDPPKRLEGGVLVFYADHITLDGETILDRDIAGHAWSVMQALRKVRPTGKRSRFSASQLARAVDAAQPPTEGAINSCIHTFRKKIGETMLESLNVTVVKNDVIANTGRGYHLADTLTIEDRDVVTMPDASATSASARPATNVPRPTTTNTANDTAESLNARQKWILQQLHQHGTLTRDRVEKQFSIGDKQAKRELSDLVRRQHITFIRRPRPGHYMLYQAIADEADVAERDDE